MTDSFNSADQASDVGTDSSQVTSDMTTPPQYSVAGKEFKDLDTFKDSYNHQEGHIKTLEGEREADRLRITELESKLTQASTLDEVLERIQRGESDVNIDTSKLTQDVAAMVRNQFQQETLVESQDKNWKDVTSVLTAAYSDKTDEVVRKVVAENDMSWDEAVHMARTNKKVFLKLFDLKTATMSPGTTTGTINTSALGDEVQEPRTTSLMKLNTDKERVDNFTARLDAKLKELGTSQY